MSKITWDDTGKRLYEAGVDHAVLYKPDDKGEYSTGVPWNGITAVTESPSGAEPTAVWADNIKYANLISAEDYGATIEAYTYPDEFAECNGESEIATGVVIGQQQRKPFGFSYRTKIANDTKNLKYGYKIHLVYGALAAPSEKNRQTINESPEAMTMSWTVTTTPVEVEGFYPTAHLEIDSTKVAADKLAELETILYGSETTEARLPLPSEIIELVGVAG